MRGIRIKRPSASMGVAFVALLAAVSGTAAALPGKNTVTSGDIKNRQVKNADLAKNSVTSLKVKDGVLRAKDFKAGELPDSPLAYARIVQTAGLAKVDAAYSKGVKTANLVDFGSGAVCIKGLPFTPKNVMATLDNFDLGFITTGVGPQVGACPAGTQIRVQTWGPTPTGAPAKVPIAEKDFAILIN
jgi:hypothetical protein